MKAIVMAGGEGVRLRPLTEGRPKPMVEFLGRPVLERAVEHLKRHGIRDIRFTLRYMPEVIQEYFGDGSAQDAEISYLVEDASLGTAGSVRACRDFIGDEDILILSGDAVCNYDLTAALDFHKSRGAQATVVTCAHPEPTAFGLVLTDGEGRITGFSEKPGWERVVTDRINTGIYILSPAIVDLIPENREYDFGKDLFPRLVREGRGVYAFPGTGYWCDIGSPEAYRRCCLDALTGRTGVELDVPEINKGVWSGTSLEGVTVNPPVYVGRDCTVEPGAVIGPETVISSKSAVSSGAVIRRSVINGGRIGPECDVDGTVVGRDAVLERNVRTGEGCVIGDSAGIGRGSFIAPGVHISGGKSVPAGRTVTRNILTDGQEAKPEFQKDWRLVGTLNASLTPETALALGGVLGRAGRVGAACCGGEGARLLADAMLCGVTASGGEGVRLDCRFEAELSYCARVFSLDHTVFVRVTGERAEVTFFDGAGLAIGSATRRKLESALTPQGHWDSRKIGGVSRLEGAPWAYTSGIVGEVRRPEAWKTPAVAVTGGGAENRALRRVLADLGVSIKEPAPGIPGFSVTPGGFDFTAVDERGRELDRLHTAAVTAQAAMRMGAETLAVPEWLPDAALRVSSRYGCKLLPMSDSRGRSLYAAQRYFRDGVYAAALVIRAMARDNAQLARLLDDLPPFAVKKERVPVRASRAGLMRLMASACAEFSTELSAGLTARTGSGVVHLTPDAASNCLVLRSESATPQQAGELAARYSRRIREIDRQES